MIYVCSYLSTIPLYLIRRILHNNLLLPINILFNFKQCFISEILPQNRNLVYNLLSHLFHCNLLPRFLINKLQRIELILIIFLFLDQVNSLILIIIRIKGQAIILASFLFIFVIFILKNYDLFKFFGQSSGLDFQHVVFFFKDLVIFFNFCSLL